MEQSLYHLIICISCKLVLFTHSHTCFSQHETVGKQRISVFVLDTIIGIEQTLDISTIQVGIIHKVLNKQQYLHHVAHLPLVHCSHGIHRATHKDAQRACYEESVFHKRTALIAQCLLIKAEQICRKIHVQFLLIVP